MTGSLRVLVADDQELVRAGFRLILEASGFIVVGEAPDGAVAVELAARHRPDVVLMDIRMPVLDGIAATRQLTASGAGAPKVVILTTFDLDDYVYEALRAGASGFLLKDTPPEQLVAAIEVVVAGDALLSPSVTRHVIGEFVKGSGPAPRAQFPRLEDLTARELEVLTLIARGLSNAEIAKTLFVSETTVKTHVARILMKLGLRDRVQVVVLAYESGVVAPGDNPDG
jgi:DNA-binding NarL/FixJ family response regulator